MLEVFVPDYNKRFAMDYKKFPSVFESSPSEEKINYTLAILTPRKIDNEIKCFLPKTECLVIKAFNGDLLVTIDEKVYELKELPRNEKFSKEFDELIEVKERKKHIPPMTHPWKLSSFKKQLQRSHYKHQYA